MTPQQQKILAFQGYDPYNTRDSWLRISDTIPFAPPRELRREFDALRWLRQAV